MNNTIPLPPLPEPVAYQRLVEGEWQQCSLFVAKGFSNKLDADCRELFAAPPAAPAPFLTIFDHFLTPKKTPNLDPHFGGGSDPPLDPSP